MQSSSKKTCSVFIIAVVLLLMGGQVEPQLSEAASAFMTCYSSCFVLCYIIPGHTTSYCSLECLKDCITPKAIPLEDASSSSGQNKIMATPEQFCKLGCASILCSNISTGKNPQVVKVAKCVAKCSNMYCTNNSHSSP